MGEFATTRKVTLGTSLFNSFDNKLKVGGDVTATMGLMHKSAPNGEVDNGENYIGGEIGAKGTFGEKFASFGVFAGFGSTVARRIKWSTYLDGTHLGTSLGAGYSIRYFNANDKSIIGHGPYVSAGIYWGPNHKGNGLPLLGLGGRFDLNLPDIKLSTLSVGVEAVF